MLRADVYERIGLAPAPGAVAALRAIERPAWLALGSGGALEALLAALPAEAREHLLRASVVAASDRLARLAGDLGFARVVTAASAMPEDLLAAAAAAAGQPPA